MMAQASAREHSVLKSLVVAALSLPLGCSSEAEPGAGSAGAAGQSSAGSSAQAGSSATGGNGTSGGPSGGAGNGAGGSDATGGAVGAQGGASSAGSSGAGTSGSGGNAGTGGAASATPSAGCGAPAQQTLGMWVEQPKLNVSGTDRQWWVWLPNAYDPARAYPLVFNFHGCSNSSNIVPMQNVTEDDAILVRATGISDNVCWDAAPGGNDVKFFDQMLTDVLAKRCVDSSRVFATGYSSGAWLVNSLECVRGDKLRAAGTVSGGRPGGNDDCKGKFARIFIHDSGDMDNRIDMGNDDERARLVLQNHCSNETMPEAPEPCVRHQGCDAGYPVIWCETQGKGHDRQDALAPGAFWKLFSSL